jgi:hypothetical protein
MVARFQIPVLQPETKNSEEWSFIVVTQNIKDVLCKCLSAWYCHQIRPSLALVINIMF